MRRRLVATFHCLRLATELIAVVTLALIIILTVADVIGRYFFNAPLGGATELTEFGIALVVFSALPAITWEDKHVAVDLLDKYVSPRLSRWRQVVINLLFATCLTAIGVRISQLAERAARREVVSEYLSLPLAWIHYYIAAACLLVAAGALLHAILGATDIFKPVAANK